MQRDKKRADNESKSLPALLKLLILTLREIIQLLSFIATAFTVVHGLQENVYLIKRTFEEANGQRPSI